MKNTKYLLWMCFLQLFIVISLSAQDSGCDNENFELGTLDGWQGFIGFITSEGEVDVSTPFNSNFQHLITNTNFSPDPVALDCELNISRVALGGNHSLRLGNKSSGGGAERVLKTFNVTAENSYFLVQYAVLLEDPGHSEHLQPRFEMRVFNEAGDLLPCGEYAVRAATGIPGFIPCNGWEVLPWTSVGFELSTYVGQEISIEFLTTDCGKGDHAGYAYIDAACLPLDITFESDICIGEGSATLSVAEGFAEYLWSNGGTERTVTIQNAAIGDVVWVELTSFTGCTITLSDTIEAPPNSLEVLLNPIEVSSICEGDTAIIEVIGSNLETIYWKDLDIYANPIELSPSSTSTYEIIPIDLNGCQHSPELVNIVVNPPPTIEITASKEKICNGESTQLFLEVNNEAGFRWLGSNDDSDNRTIQPNETDLFYAQADGLGTCPNVWDSILIVVEESLPMTYSKTSDTKICMGESVSLGIEEATNVAAIDWIDLNSEAFAVEIIPLESQYFYVDLTADGCSYTQRDSILVTVIPDLKGGFLGESRCIDATVLLDAGLSSDGEDFEVNYLWQDGSTNSTFEVMESGTYSVEVSNDCEVLTESITLQLADVGNCSFEIPSAFSPNDDGINDVLQVVTNCSNIPLNRFIFKVFNRWGEVVFETNDVEQSWNGYRGFDALPNGLYVWWLSFEGETEGICGQSIFKKGNVVLIR